MKNRIWLFIVLISFQSCGQTNSIDKNISIDIANQAYSTYNFAKALSLYEAFWNGTNSDKKDERVLAAQRLAYFAWHVDQDIEKARLWTEKALSLDYNKSGSLKALSLFELEAENFKTALDLAKQSLLEAKTEFEARLATEQLCKSIFNEAKNQLKKGKDIDAIFAKEALEKINDLTIKYPEDLDIAKLQIGIAIINEDFSSAFQAWKNYFRIDHLNPPNGLLGISYEFLQKIDVSGLVFSQMDTELLKGIAISFANSRLFDYATLLRELLDNDILLGSDILNNVNLYNTYLNNAEDLTYQFYRDLAKGIHNQQQFKNNLLDLEEAFWKQLKWSEKQNSFSHNNFLNATKKLFGAKQTRGIVNGYYAFYCWHEISNENVSINQYGRNATLKVTSMDYLVSNDYSGWFHSEQRVGGTANSNSIDIVRPAMLQEPVLMWNQFKDPTMMKEMRNQITRLQKLDIELAKENPYALLQGMRLNILIKNIEQIHDSLNNSGLVGSKLKLGFINYLSDFFHRHTMIHEARHAIDVRIGGFDKNQLEYRAKLSEVALSNNPLLTFAAQVLREESPNASHGMANSRLVRDMVKWMTKNSHQIKNYENGKPLILQLDKLTNEQVVIAMRSLDPLVKD